MLTPRDIVSNALPDLELKGRGTVIRKAVEGNKERAVNDDGDDGDRDNE